MSDFALPGELYRTRPPPVPQAEGVHATGLPVRETSVSDRKLKGTNIFFQRGKEGGHLSHPP